MIDMKKTGENIRRLQGERGISAPGLVRYMGLNTTRVISRWRSGRTLPSTENLYALAKALEVHIHDIVVEKKNPGEINERKSFW